MGELGDLEDVVRDFLVESYENLDQLDRDLVALERDPRSPDRLASVFRTIHTIKGTCGFLGFGKLERVAHAGESLLAKLRDGDLVLDAEITTGLLSMLDAIREMLGHIEAARDEGGGDYDALVATLEQLQGPRIEARAPAPVEARPPAPPPQAAPLPAVEAACAEAGHEDGRGSVSDSSIRVDVGLLDKLMNLVGELVLARNQVLQLTASLADGGFQATSQRLNLITTELQEGVMKTRMQPIGNVWGRFPRVVRDLALACGKDVRIEMDGRETDLDKTIIEAIKDPLTHLVRNAVDHGVEPPDVRERAGKPRQARLFLRAYHEGGQVTIEVGDDGAGLDLEGIRRKAVQRGLVTAEQAARLSDREATDLIFLPGFSTARTITNISGRGVGMDVVRTNIEKIGGTVDVQSRPGQGTTLRMKIPLTLAIIPALIVASGGDRYAIPQVSLLELVRLEGDEARSGIESVHGAPVYRLRGDLLPLVHLHRALDVEELKPPGDEDAVNIVVLQADDRQFGLVVESIADTEEIVVKPLATELKGLTPFAGATIMGDGKVALILDVMGLAQRAGVISQVHDRALGDRPREAGHVDDRDTLLLVGIGARARLAIPLGLVARLEELPAAAVEQASGHEAVQYRDQIMRLVRLADVLGLVPEEPLPGAPLQVVVYARGGECVGLVVDHILDIVEEQVTVRARADRPGLLGSAVVQGRVTDLVDLECVVRLAAAAFGEQVEAR